MSSAIELAKILISRSSLTPNDAGCQSIISERLTRAGFHCEPMRFGEVDNLWARFGSQSPLVVFAGHTDVVPAGPEFAWTSPPFQPEIRNGFLYGRGTADMKGALAAMIVAAEKFVQENPHSPGSLALLITSDEEGPAIHGTKKVIETLTKRGEKIDYCIVGEASTDMQIGDQIRIGRRGSLSGKLTVHGKQGHVAFPHLAKNAIHESLAALHTLTQIVWDNGNEHFPPTTFQLSNIHGGTGAANVIPGMLEVLLNFRFSPALTTSELQERTEAILQQHALTYNIEWEIGGEPFLTRQGKLIESAKAAIKEVTGLDVKCTTGGGTSDGRYIAPTGAEVIELGASHATIHQVDECVRVEDFEVLTKIYQKILMLLFY